MPFPSHVFRANDIRGLLEEITPDLAQAVGAALVAMTQAKTIIVGRDMRSTSPALAEAAIAGITKMGANVIDIGMCTTSMYNFAVSSRGDADAGLMVTASHNPAEYNGIKFARANGLPIPGTEFAQVRVEKWGQVGNREFGDERGQVRNSEFGEVGTVSVVDILPEYLAACLELADMPDVRGTRLAIDFGNGMGALSVLPLCARLGVEVVSLYADPDARFPNHEANPAKEETLTDVKALVLKEHADFGVALDGDADRIAFIDNEGVSLRGDETLGLMTLDALRTQPSGKVVITVNAGWRPGDALREAGGEVVDCQIGRTKVVKLMHDVGALMGGELSSHFMFSNFNNLEAVDHALVRMLALWKRHGGTMAEAAHVVRANAHSGEVNLEVHDKVGAIERVKAAFIDKATRVETIDGIRCEFDRDWWFLVRASNTEPILRLTVEAKTEAAMREHVDALSKIILAV